MDVLDALATRTRDPTNRKIPAKARISMSGARRDRTDDLLAARMNSEESADLPSTSEAVMHLHIGLFHLGWKAPE